MHTKQPCSYKNALCLALVITSLFATFVFASEQNVYFGTGTKKGDGIYHSLFNSNTGELSIPNKVADLTAPSFLAKHPSLAILYAVANINQSPVVAAYTIEPNGALSLINYQAINNKNGTHISVHPSGKFLLTAQYSGGSVAVFPLNTEGAVLPRSQLFEHQGGSKVVANKQDSAHPHWVGFSPDSRFAFVPDLGLDTIKIYRVTDDETQLVAYSQANTIAGGGPRHMRFSTNGQFIYLLNEFTLSISTFEYNKESGLATLSHVTSALDEQTKSQEAFNSASEILVHKSGKFVYSANRGHDSVSVFSSKQNTGQLELREVEHVRGSFPRNINLDHTGKWLFAAGQHSNTVSVFSVDQQTGLLQYQTGNTVNLPEPTCVLFVQ